MITVLESNGDDATCQVPFEEQSTVLLMAEREMQEKAQRSDEFGTPKTVTL
jgi:hypothetical protein